MLVALLLHNLVSEAQPPRIASILCPSNNSAKNHMALTLYLCVHRRNGKPTLGEVLAAAFRRLWQVLAKRLPIATISNRGTLSCLPWPLRRAEGPVLFTHT